MATRAAAAASSKPLAPTAPRQRVVVVDMDVLEEIRGLRADFKELAAQVARSATRDDLAGYVTREVYDAHVASHARGMDARRWWATYGLGIVSLILAPLFYALIAHVSFVFR
jgi:hypothetical protein